MQLQIETAVGHERIALAFALDLKGQDYYLTKQL